MSNNGYTMDLTPVFKELIPNYERLKPLLSNAQANINQMRVTLTYDLQTFSDMEQAIELMDRIRSNHQREVEYYKGLGLDTETEFLGQVYFTL